MVEHIDPTSVLQNITNFADKNRSTAGALARWMRPEGQMNLRVSYTAEYGVGKRLNVEWDRMFDNEATKELYEEQMHSQHRPFYGSRKHFV
ncbi:MAG: hypothetical protein A3H27_13320 [Acidobacteria bacterium RIFCSPLOWO2_02_FULL_59_13]|nr:MAG: hypothetical protein A3H27_13320 [Acidobacteria bacterium RIFCSPLOWO2_02_FULL_59_13]